MTTSSIFDRRLEQVTAGGHLTAPELAEIAAAPDILSLGMLADVVRRRIHGTQITYLRVAECACDQLDVDAIPASAREVRIVGVPASLDAATGAVERARTASGGRAVSGFSWGDVDRVAAAAGLPVSRVLAMLHSVGLEALVNVPLDAIGDPERVVNCLMEAGFQRLRFTIDKAPASDRQALFQQASALQEQYGSIQTINPLPTVLHAVRPTTGYDDVKAVAIARLAAPNIPAIQVDWLRYGPKLAQVALTFGADDLDAVPASDDAPEGRRRAPLEEMRRNVEAAGFSPIERDGHFNVVA
jgi:aminodeoxyfutalosine synthase